MTGWATPPTRGGRSGVFPPRTVIRRGEIVVRDGEPCAERGSGRFLRRERPASAAPSGRPSWAVALARRLGAEDFLK